MEKPLYETKRIGKKLSQYNKAQQEHFLLIREEIKVFKKMVNSLEQSIKKTDVFTVMTYYNSLMLRMNEKQKEINKKSKIVLDKINKQ